MGEEIKKILEAGIQAPSADNCQPWKFITNGNTIALYNNTTESDSIYNWGERSSYVAHGAVIENIVIASENFGYIAEVKYFTKQSDPNLVAEIIITPSSIKSKEGLYQFINKRTTNRKPYENVSLTSEQVQQLTINKFDQGRIKFELDREKIKILASVGSANEHVMLSNKRLHDFFFKHVNWTKEEDEQKKIGFYIKTLELPPPARIMFKILSHWSIAKYLSKINFPGVVAKQNAQINAKCGAVGAIIMNGDSREDFVIAGRIMQRLWLRATSMKLYIQPLGGILFLRLKLISGESHEFSSKEIAIINKSYENVKDIFKAGSGTIAMMFRIGEGPQPTARASRINLNNVTEFYS